MLHARFSREVPPSRSSGRIVTSNQQPPEQRVETRPFDPGRLVGGRFELTEVLGEGGTSVVYGALDRRWSEEVALKVLRRERLADPRRCDAFFAEAEIGLRLSHRHLARVEEIAFESDLPFLVMRRLRGPSLRERLHTEGELKLPPVLAILRQLTLGLAELHCQGLVHGDVKPENVLLDERRGAVLIDFGVAARLRRRTAEPPETVLGTVGYLSPEQARGEPLDARSDLYGVGLLGLEMLTGSNPFAGGNVFEVVIRHMVAGERAFAQLEQRVSPRAWSLLGRCLEPVAADRYRSAGELIEAIDVAARPSWSTALPSPSKLAASLSAGLATLFR